MRFGFIISLVFAIIVAIFGIQNAAVISVNFFSTNFNISLALLIFISAIIGAIIIALLGLKKEFLLSRGNKQLKKNAKGFKSDLDVSKNNNAALNTENQILQSKLQDLETKNKTLMDEISELKIELKRLNNISTSETNSL